MADVGRYRAVYGYASGWSFSGPSDPEIRKVANEGPGIDIVFASDYDQLRAERDDLRQQLKRALDKAESWYIEAGKQRTIADSMRSAYKGALRRALAAEAVIDAPQLSESEGDSIKGDEYVEKLDAYYRDLLRRAAVELVDLLKCLGSTPDDEGYYMATTVIAEIREYLGEEA